MSENRNKSGLLGNILDVVAALVVALSVVLLWFALWTTFDCFLPINEHHVWGTLVVGFCGSFACMYSETTSLFSESSKHKASHVCVKFVHDFLVMWFQVMLWKGWWDLLDLYTKSMFAQVCEALIGTLILVSCRALTVTTQFTITRENVMLTPPSTSDTLATGMSSSANITSTLVLVHILSITVWAQVWNLTDRLLLASDDLYYQSTCLSLALGLLILLLVFIFDQIKSHIFCCCLSNPSQHSCFLFLVYYVTAATALFASIQCWRGCWGVAEYYMEKSERELSVPVHTQVLVLCILALMIYMVVFSLGYSQNIASFSLDFDKCDLDLSRHFLIWSDSSLPKDSPHVLEVNSTEIVPRQETRLGSVKIEQKNLTTSKLIVNGKSENSFTKVLSSFTKDSSKGRFSIPEVNGSVSEPLLNGTEDEELFGLNCKDQVVD